MIISKGIPMQSREPKSEKLPNESDLTDNSQHINMLTLRQKAKLLMEQKQPPPFSMRDRSTHQGIPISDTEILKLIYDLELHQIELELQNSELQSAKDQIEASAARYAELYNFSPSGYLSLSREGDIIETNLFGSQLLGKDSAHLINSRFGFFVTDESRPTFNNFMETLFNGKIKGACDITLCSGEGKPPMNIHLSGIITEGREKCLIAATDISELKRSEEEIQLKNLELQRVNAEKDKFFSIIAHDLRSPFNGFLGLTEVMAEGLSGMTVEEIQKIVTLMKNSATNLNHLLVNLLEWSRMERGLTSFTPESCFLISVVEESLVLVSEAAKVKDISINYEIPENLAVVADKNMLESILRNLASNAVKFTPQRGLVTISAKSLPDQWIELSIRDTGIGMSHNIINNLFRLDNNSGRRGTNGELSSGLGLIICKDFVEKHGGKLGVESQEGEGTTFHFTLPAWQTTSSVFCKHI